MAEPVEHIPGTGEEPVNSCNVGSDTVGISVQPGKSCPGSNCGHFEGRKYLAHRRDHVLGGQAASAMAGELFPCIRQ